MILLGIAGILSTKLTTCGNKLFKLYCHSYEIVKLSCENTIINNVFCMFILLVTCDIPLSLILYSYIKILIICQ